MASSHQGHQHVLFFFQKSLRNLFWSAFLRQNAIGLVDIFTFVYLYRLGIAEQFFPIASLSNFQQGILTVVADVVILRVVELLIIIPLAQVTSKLGLPKAAIIGNCLLAIRYLLLAFSTRYPYLIFSAAILQGIEISVFTPAYDTMFAKRASTTKVGRDVGAFTFILKLTYALLPVLAGGLIITFGFASAFVGSTLLLILANIPLLLIRWNDPLEYPTVKGFWTWLQEGINPRISIAIIGKYLNSVSAELWPIYLIIVFGKIESLGVVMSVALCISLLTIYFTGWYVDHSKKNVPFIFGGVVLAALWILRINSTLVSVIVILEIIQRIGESFVYPSFDALLYRISKKINTFSFHLYREALTAVVSLGIWLILGFIFISYGAVWNWVFIFGAIGILLSTFLYSV